MKQLECEGVKKQPTIQEIAEYTKDIDNKKREIVEYYYGLNGKEKMTTQQIADKLGVGSHYIYYNLNKIKEKIIEEREQ